MLTMQNVMKKFGEFTALQNINLEFSGGVYGLLAPNGAGKTTLLKIIATMLLPTSGEILYEGTEIQRLGDEYRNILGYLPQNFGYYRNDSPKQYLLYLSALKGIKKKTAVWRTEELLDRMALNDVKDRKMKKLSGGMIQRIGIAQAMLNDPKILVLDEPTAGLDPKERGRFRDIITELSKDCIVIFSTHIVSDVESVANHIILIKDKEVFCNSDRETLCHTLENKVYETYLPVEEVPKFEKKYFILSRREEAGRTMLRFVCEKNAEPDFTLSMPNLEDYFLYVYRGE